MNTLCKRDPITEFQGEYRWLSNFWLVDIPWGADITFPSVENAYQGLKTFNWSDTERFVNMTPAEAKREGRLLEIRPDWDVIKPYVMLMLLKAKFKNPELAQKLKDTEDALLIEGNTWGDTYWGQVDGKGENWLGFLLMKVRDRL